VAAARAGKPITAPQPPWLNQGAGSDGGAIVRLLPVAQRRPAAKQAARAGSRAGVSTAGVPAIRGVLDLPVNRPFLTHGRLVQLDLRSDGGTVLAGTPVELADGRQIGTTGDKRCALRECADGLELLCVPLPGDPAGQTAVEICAEGARFHATAHASGGGRRTQCSESGQMVDHLENWSLTKIVIAPTEFAFQTQSLVV
jgi:hypothetical protein